MLPCVNQYFDVKEGETTKRLTCRGQTSQDTVNWFAKGKPPGSQCLYREQVDHNKHDDANIKNNNSNQSYINNSISYNNRILLLLILLLTIIYNYHPHHHADNMITVVRFFILYPISD